MGMGLLPDEGIAGQLENILSTPFSGLLNWSLVIWVNNITPTFATVFADLVEASWPGYTRQQLTRDGWTTPVVNEGCCQSTWGTEPIVYNVGTLSAPVTNYGVAYYDQASGVLRWVQRFDDADIAPLVSGSQVLILPQYTLTSAACSVIITRAGRPGIGRRKRKKK